MHLGNTTTNRVESSHSCLKKYVMNSLDDINKNREHMDNMLTNMFIELKKDFPQSINFRDERFMETVMWSELQGNISREALHYLVDEVCRMDSIGTNKAKCGCLLMSTMRLLCTCLLVMTAKEDKPISLAG
ncbi:hypothetical protein QL285_076461 [Trifolium repens]|nr:hypothetical protein QL285_076461 [Trifolium repens]